MAGQSFAAQVSEWAKAETDRQEAVFQAAAQMVADEVRLTVHQGGRMPIDTGNLRRSLMASTSAMPSVKQDQEEFTNQAVEMVIAGAELGGTVYLGFQANYALRREFGFVGTDSLGRLYNETGSGFVSATAQRWNQIVAEAEAIIRGRFEAGSPPA